MSLPWIHQGDVSPLLAFGQLRHDHLRILAMECGRLRLNPVLLMLATTDWRAPRILEMERTMSVPNELFEAIVEKPLEEAPWTDLADFLDRHEPRRGELLRLHRRLLATRCEPDSHPERAEWQSDLVKLLQKGVKPCLPEITVDLGKGVEMTFHYIPPGTFLMGSPPDEEGRGDAETQHRVTRTKGVYLGIYPVTQGQWQAVLGSNPSLVKTTSDCPVENVSWQDVQSLCKKLTAIDRRPYRLPTEAEWEDACRAGTTTPFFFGLTISGSQACYDGNSVYGPGKKGKNHKEITPVGSFKPNAWGLYDMHGNIWEWCRDWYVPFEAADQTDPKGPPRGQTRVIRGGARGHHPNYLRSAARGAMAPGYKESSIGCRIAIGAS